MAATPEVLEQYDRKDYKSARSLLEGSLASTNSDEDGRENCLFNIASCLASEGEFLKALDILDEITKPNNDLIYNKALCHYKLKNYEESLKLVDELLDNCRRAFKSNLSVVGDRELKFFPENIDNDTNGLLQSCLIEGLNLKSAILYKTNGKCSESKRCLEETPFQTQDQMDCVTLHNQAIYEQEIDINSSLSKLNYLCKLDQEWDEPNFASLVPYDVYRNLLVICANHNKNFILPFMDTNRTHIETRIRQDELQFLEIQMEEWTSASESVCLKLEKFLDRLLERAQQAVADDMSSVDKMNLQQEHDEIIELALCVTTHLSSILWNENEYQALERLMLKLEPEFGQLNLWKKNMAHILYMLDTRYDDCVQLYEELLPKSETESLLAIDPVIISNLCVSYVLTGRNNDAESLIKAVETEEIGLEETSDIDTLDVQVTGGQSMERVKINSPSQHMSTIDLTIGTLYCVKLNYEFGLTRLIKSLEPATMRKLNTTTWSQVKCCILSLLDYHCKQMIFAKEELLNQVVAFLIQCEKHGFQIETNYDGEYTSAQELSQSKDSERVTVFLDGRNSVIYEARYLRSLVLTIIHD